MPLGAIPLPQKKPIVLSLPKTRGKSVKELTGDQLSGPHHILSANHLLFVYDSFFSSLYRGP